MWGKDKANSPRARFLHAFNLRIGPGWAAQPGQYHLRVSEPNSAALRTLGTSDRPDPAEPSLAGRSRPNGARFSWLQQPGHPFLQFTIEAFVRAEFRHV